MSDAIIHWIMTHFPWGATLLGLGSGSAGTLIGKSMIDKKQDSRIKKVEKSLSEISDNIKDINSKLKLNELGDKNLTESVNDLKQEFRDLRNKILGVKISK